MRRLACLIALCMALFVPPTAQATGKDVTVFAAASLKTVLDEVGAAFAEATRHEAVLSFAGSSVLARQIGFGAPADVFLSANPHWMDVLEEAGSLTPGTRRDLLGNALVLISHAPGAPVDLNAQQLTAALGDGRLAMALVDAVPAGIYGKSALQSLDIWDRVAPQVAQTDNVRSALALVALGEAPLGIVYATDALADPRVHLRASFPAASHDAITYPVAGIGAEPDPAARAYLEFLSSPEAREIFRAHGFVVLED